jgi:penicillin amidase
MDGLSAPVRLVRDRWGIPHIDAASQDDLFFAQGFVQAEDRLFQMDLWRRSVQGRLSEVLGANFIERDVMTRRVQYHGDVDADWASYGPDARTIAAAFVRGVNAWVAIARAHPPEEFALAGWRPDFWTPEDLLNRTDAFVAGENATTQVLRARLVAAVGARRADALLPTGVRGPMKIPPGLDLATISPVVADALRRVGTEPFFLGLAGGVGPPPRRAGSNAWLVSPARSATGAAILANDPHRPFDHPSWRYLVHLHAPGWNVIGATPPWLPGVEIGHNDRVAWGLTSLAPFTDSAQDLYVEKVNPANPHQVLDRGRWVDTDFTQGALPVKGRKEPFTFDIERTRHGVVVAVDRDRHLAFTVRWAGTEPGTAAGLAAVTLDRAGSWPEFRAALARWKTPSVDVLYADVDGNTGRQAAALIPRGWSGAVPAPAWTNAAEWHGWLTLDDLPHAFNARAGYAIAVNGSVPRTERLRQALSGAPAFGVDEFKMLQHDTVSWTAAQLLPQLARAQADAADVEAARRRLVAWDGHVSADSTDATMYVFWERALRRAIAAAELPPLLARDYVPVAEALNLPVPVSVPAATLVEALASALKELRTAVGSSAVPTWGSLHAATFRHPLGVTEAARRRFNVGPFPIGGYESTVMATVGQAGATGGASYRQIIDLADWDRMVVSNAPGQSGSPASPHFSDLAARWAAGEYVPLAFSAGVVGAATETTLTLVPR